MTGQQFDTIVGKLNNILERIEMMELIINKQNEILKLLTDKTVVVNMVDEEIKRLRLDIDSLKDEGRM